MPQDLKKELSPLMVSPLYQSEAPSLYVRCDRPNTLIQLTGRDAEIHASVFKESDEYWTGWVDRDAENPLIKINEFQQERIIGILHFQYYLQHIGTPSFDTLDVLYEKLAYQNPNQILSDKEKFSIENFIWNIDDKTLKTREHIIYFLFNVFEKLSEIKGFNEGTPCLSFEDIVTPGKAIHCLHLAALAVYVLQLKNIKARLCSGLGYNTKILEHDHITVHYFSDDTEGFGSVGHAWIDFLTPTGEHFIFDPTMYFSKIIRMQKINELGYLLTEKKEEIQSFHLHGTYHHLLFEQVYIQPKSGYPANYRRKKTLLMFSGGFDSTAALYHLLITTNDNLHVHRVRLHSDRVDAEQQAADQIIAYCRTHFRPFTYRESTLKLEILDHYGYDDVYNITFICAQIVKYGHQGTPFDYAYCAGLNLDEEDRYFEDATKRENESTKMFYYLLNIGNETPIAIQHIVYEMCYWRAFQKADVVNLLPHALKALAWTCRTPILHEGKYLICGECPSCLHLKDCEPKTQH